MATDMDMTMDRDMAAVVMGMVTGMDVVMDDTDIRTCDVGISKDRNTVVTRGGTVDNLDNLDIL